MNDENKKHKSKIRKLKKEIEEMKIQVSELSKKIEENNKKLKENIEADEKRSQEIQKIQKEHHKENLFWNKLSGFGSLTTPLALSLFGLWLKNKKNKSASGLGFFGSKPSKE